MSRRASEALGVTEEAHVLSAPARVFTREWFDDLRELCMEMEREGLLNDGERVFSGLVGFIKEYDYSRDRDLERG